MPSCHGRASPVGQNDQSANARIRAEIAPSCPCNRTRTTVHEGVAVVAQLASVVRVREVPMLMSRKRRASG